MRRAVEPGPRRVLRFGHAALARAPYPPRTAPTCALRSGRLPVLPCEYFSRAGAVLGRACRRRVLWCVGAALGAPTRHQK